jgi:hypothetical protein
MDCFVVDSRTFVPVIVPTAKLHALFTFSYSQTHAELKVLISRLKLPDDM